MTKLNVKKIPKEPNLRFPYFRGEWGEIKIKEILTERKKKYYKESISCCERNK